MEDRGRGRGREDGDRPLLESAPARLTESLPPHRVDSNKKQLLAGKLQLQAWVRVMNEAQLVKVIKVCLEDESLAMRRLFSHHNMEGKCKNLFGSDKTRRVAEAELISG